MSNFIPFAVRWKRTWVGSGLRARVHDSHQRWQCYNRSSQRHHRVGGGHPHPPVTLRVHVPVLHRGPLHLQEAALSVGPSGSSLQLSLSRHVRSFSGQQQLWHFRRKKTCKRPNSGGNGNAHLTFLGSGIWSLILEFSWPRKKSLGFGNSNPKFRLWCTVVTHRLGYCFADTDTHFSHQLAIQSKKLWHFYYLHIWTFNFDIIKFQWFD